MELSNIFESMPANPDEEVVDLIAQNENAKIERIISRGQTSPVSGWYDQEKDEWVLVLKGEAIISFDNGKEVNLKAGDHIKVADIEGEIEQVGAVKTTIKCKGGARVSMANTTLITSTVSIKS